MPFQDESSLEKRREDTIMNWLDGPEWNLNHGYLATTLNP